MAEVLRIPVSEYSTSGRTKQALVRAAGELLAEHGEGRVSTRRIAERARENLGSIHYHFGNKEGLIKEVLRFACHSQPGPSVPEVVQLYEEQLGDTEGQVRAVRALIRHVVQEIMSPDRPRWCARVLYQVLQHPGPLRGFLRKERIDPFFEAITRLLHRIRPEWSRNEVYLWIHVTIGAIVFHSDHREIILERLGSNSFPADYVAPLEERIAADALRGLGLPTGEI